MLLFKLMFFLLVQTEPRIFYGNRVHYLCTKASLTDVRDIMASMQHVVRAMLKRVQEDLSGDEIARCLQAFNLDCWQEPNNHSSLQKRFQALASLLCEAGEETASTLKSAAKALAPVMRTARNQQLAVDNRKAWSWVLTPAWRAKYAPKVVWTPHCDLLVNFYLSLKINTTTLERDLGELLAHLTAHSGPLSKEGGTVSSIMEVHIEGPQSEEEFFLPPDKPGAPCQPTEFAQLCAKLWLEHFGRRFRYAYKPKSKVQGLRSTSQAQWLQLSVGGHKLHMPWLKVLVVHVQRALFQAWLCHCRRGLPWLALDGSQRQQAQQKKHSRTLRSTPIAKDSEPCFLW